MEVHFRKVIIIGVGLLGASLGMAMRSKKMAEEIVGIGRNRETLEKALQKGAVDTISTEILPHVRDADFIILCTPVLTSITMLQSIANYIQPDKVVMTDVCSTKVAICNTAQSIWQQNSPFIGSHPLAGSEKFGPEYASERFYEGTVCLLEKGDNVRSGVKETVKNFWEHIGTKVIEISAEEHDFFLGYTSHLPHVIASALAQVVGETDAKSYFIGGGFRDTTRIAESRPELWRDIILTNRENIILCIDKFQEKLENFKYALQTGQGEKIMEFFQQGSESRKRLFNP